MADDKQSKHVPNVHTRHQSAIEFAHQPTAEIIVGLPEIRNHCSSTRDQEWAHEI